VTLSSFFGIFIQYCSKVWGRKDFFMVLKEVSYAHQGCVYLIRKQSNVIYKCNLLSHDASEIILIWWFAALETCLIINVKNSCAWYFSWKPWCTSVLQNSICLAFDFFALNIFSMSLLIYLMHHCWQSLIIMKNPHTEHEH